MRTADQAIAGLEVETLAMAAAAGRGLVLRAPAAEYHALDAMSRSRLAVLRDQTPAHLRWSLDHPDEKTSADLRFGRLVHVRVFEPELWALDYRRAPPGDRRTKAYKDEAAFLLARNPRAELVDPDEYDRVEAVAAAVLAHRSAAGVLAGGDYEVSALWTDDQTGLLSKARFDSLTRTLGAIVDLKTTRDASPRAFARSVYEYGYHLQAAFYCQGARALGIPVLHYAIVAVEKAPPYPVAVYRVADEAVRAGERTLVELKERYARAVRESRWPSWPQEIQDISLPPWAWKELER